MRGLVSYATMKQRDDRNPHTPRRGSTEAQQRDQRDQKEDQRSNVGHTYQERGVREGVLLLAASLDLRLACICAGGLHVWTAFASYPPATSQK